MIWFQPGKLSTKPDALTRRWDVYPKEGDTGYAKANPQNYRPIFTEEQLIASLHATFLEGPTLRTSIIMNIDNLHNTILQSYSDDSNAVSGLEQINQTESRWTREEDGLLRLDGRIFVPIVSDLRLQVLRYFHDHSLAGHFRQNWTLELI